MALVKEGRIERCWFKSERCSYPCTFTSNQSESSNIVTEILSIANLMAPVTEGRIERIWFKSDIFIYIYPI